MAKIGYAGVSTSQQTTARQDDALAELGVNTLFVEKIGAKNANRPELKKMLEYVREGDIIVVSDISRLARSTRDLLSIIDTLNQKHVGFVSLKENIDTTSPQGRFVLTIFGALAELERDNILSRQREGIDAAKARGKKFGRPVMEFPKNWEKVYKQWKARKINPTDAAKELGLKRPTFYLMIKRWEVKSPVA
jgi:DNA invertase Pin-like site-specific DNA recombinase